jgi:hypothetical protein
VSHSIYKGFKQNIFILFRFEDGGQDICKSPGSEGKVSNYPPTALTEQEFLRHSVHLQASRHTAHLVPYCIKEVL